MIIMKIRKILENTMSEYLSVVFLLMLIKMFLSRPYSETLSNVYFILLIAAFVVGVVCIIWNTNNRQIKCSLLFQSLSSFTLPLLVLIKHEYLSSQVAIASIVVFELMGLILAFESIFPNFVNREKGV